MSCRLERIHKVTEAAKSGKYEQAFGKLKEPGKDNCFCILGLMCEVFRLENKQGYWNEDGYFETEVLLDDNDDEGYQLREMAEDSLPTTVSKWYGLGYESNPFGIISKNDDDKLPLDKLAEIIEEGCKTKMELK